MIVPEKFKDHIQLSNSRREQIAGCQRKFYWQYELGIQTAGASIAMFYGSMWHYLLDQYYTHIKENGRGNKDALGRTAAAAAMGATIDEWHRETDKQPSLTPDYRNLENMAKAFYMYIEEYGTFNFDASMEIISAEKPFYLEFILTEDEAKKYPELIGKKLLITGIIDLVFKSHGYIWIMEHKSTGAYIASIANKQYRSAQTIGYFWAATMLFPDLLISGCMTNIHHISSKLKKDGEYGKLNIEFHRDALAYTQGDIREWRLSQCEEFKKMLEAKERNAWPMNLDRCYDYFSKCAFEELCQQNKADLSQVTINPERYTERIEKDAERTKDESKETH